MQHRARRRERKSRYVVISHKLDGDSRTGNQPDTRWEQLKLQIQQLSDEKNVLLRELEAKNTVIDSLKMNNTRYVPSTKPTQHKVISSADHKKLSERRRKEEQQLQLVASLTIS